jgi:peptide/nickel transport system substrate-binding protein
MPTQVNDVTWRATIRDDRTFSDGSPITANDVKYSWDRIKQPSLASFAAGYLGFIKSVNVVGTDTVEFVTVAPVSALPDRFAMVRVVSEKYIAKVGAKYFSTNGGCGSSSMYNKVPLSPSGINLVPYEKYNGVLPVYTDKAAFTYYPETSTAFAELLSGEINVVPFLPPNDVIAAQDDKSLKVGYVPNARSTLICLLLFNCGKKPFNDQRVRQAVMYAMNREQLVTIGTGGYGIVADSPLPKSNPYHVTPASTYPHDPDKAKFLLKQAGYGDGLTFDLYVSNLGATANYAPLLEGQMASAGINAKVRVLSVDSYFSEIFAGKYESFVFPTQFGNFSPDTDNLIRGWWGGYYNAKAAFWTTPAANSIPGLLNKALYSTHEATKRTAYGDVQEIIMAAAANVPIIFQAGVTAWSGNMAGFVPPAGGELAAVYKVHPQ